MPIVVEPSWLGRRVSIRRVLERDPSGDLRLGDVVGDLLGLDAQTAVVDTRNGPVEIPLPLVAAARIAPPSTADELALEATMTRGLRPAETAEFDGWLLRADHGLARRANSVLPLRRPGAPLAEALAHARDWYAARGLPLVVALPTEARRLLDAELAELGWPAEAETHVLAARLDRLAADAGAATVDPLPADDWMARFDAGDGEHDLTRALLTRHDAAGFARIDDADGVPVAIGRGVVDDGWFGVSGVQVAPDARRRGLARRVMAALTAWAGERGATRSYLQVFVTNEAAITLYRDLGYWHHHDYRYRREPAP